MRSPTADDLERLVSHPTATGTAELPWLAACWIETNSDGTDTLRWSLDRANAPRCARTHLLAGRHALRRS